MIDDDDDFDRKMPLVGVLLFGMLVVYGVVVPLGFWLWRHL